jgi:AAA+ ATPase superfamily predicted ATPase
MKKAVSPFRYGTIVKGRFFTDREEEIKKLKNNFLSGINTVIISPRRWGKSSLVEKTAKEIISENKNMRIAFIDLFNVKTEIEFYEKFAKEVIKACSSKFEDVLNDAKDLLKNIIPVFHISPVPEADFKLSFNWDDAEKYKDDILDLPERIAVKRKIKLVVCIDEFQNLANVSGFQSIEKKLRAHWQKHGNAAYCLYGSKKHMLKEIFTSSGKPFYRFGDIFFLNKIKAEKWLAFIVKSFESTGKSISEKPAMKIIELMDCHPWYVQQLSYYVWNISGKSVTEKDVITANEQVINTNSPLYIRDCENLSSTQVNLLTAIVSGEKMLTSAAVMQKYSLGTPRNVSKNKEMLMNNDFIDEFDGKICFVDPVFLQWFKLNYSPLNLSI